MALFYKPLINFNKNNPFVIQAKFIYENILNSLNKYIKRLIIVCSIKLFLLLFIIIIGLITTKKFNTISICTILLYITLNLSILINHIKYIHSVINNEIIFKFQNYSNLSISEISEINNEDLLNITLELYKLNGDINRNPYINILYEIIICLLFIWIFMLVLNI